MMGNFPSPYNHRLPSDDIETGDDGCDVWMTPRVTRRLSFGEARPHEGRLDAEAEDRLCRLCFVLGLCEEPSREGPPTLSPSMRTKITYTSSPRKSAARHRTNARRSHRLGTSWWTGGLKGPSNLGRIERCAYYLVACSTAYRKKGCRCARCRAWKSAEHQRQRYGSSATGQTPQDRQPVEHPVEAVRAEPDGVVEGVPTAPLRPTIRLGCGHLLTLPWWEAYPGRAATCADHGPTLVKSLTSPNKRDVRASPGPSAKVGGVSFHVHYSPLSWR